MGGTQDAVEMGCHFPFIDAGEIADHPAQG
jgi:hypothetical protein